MTSNKTLFALIVFLGLILLYMLVPFKQILKNKPRPKEIDAIPYFFGKEKMMVYDKMSVYGYKDEYKLPNNRMSRIFFEAKISPDDCIVLTSRLGDDYYSDGNNMTIRLSASTKHQHGKILKQRYNDSLNGSYNYSLPDGEIFGLKKYVEYLRSRDIRPANLSEHLVTMKNDEMPLRLLTRTHSPAFGKTAGGVYHYFMYNDQMQIKIHYRKVFLKDWQRIETAMRKFIDTLYAEAKQYEIIYYSDTSNPATRHCPKAK